MNINYFDILSARNFDVKVRKILTKIKDHGVPHAIRHTLPNVHAIFVIDYLIVKGFVQADIIGKDYVQLETFSDTICIEDFQATLNRGFFRKLLLCTFQEHLHLQFDETLMNDTVFGDSYAVLCWHGFPRYISGPFLGALHVLLEQNILLAHTCGGGNKYAVTQWYEPFYQNLERALEKIEDSKDKDKNFVEKIVREILESVMSSKKYSRTTFIKISTHFKILNIRYLSLLIKDEDCVTENLLVAYDTDLCYPSPTVFRKNIGANDTNSKFMQKILAKFSDRERVVLKKYGFPTAIEDIQIIS